MKLAKLAFAIGLITLMGAGCAKAPAPAANLNANKPAIGTSRAVRASGSFTVTLDPATGEFIPVTAYVTKGTKVTFKNTTDKPHHIVPGADPKLKLDDLNSKTDLAPGESFTYTFNKVGAWLYEDSLHPAFGGAVDVAE